MPETPGKLDPLVSIIIPTFNRSHYLGETLDCLIKQSFLNWECLVIDDGSTDYTKELMEFYCTAHPRIRFYSRPVERPKGANTCRNYGFELSEGKYIQWLDSDDLISENKISEQVKLLIADDDLELSFCKWAKFNFDKTNAVHQEKSGGLSWIIEPKELFDHMGRNNVFFPPHAYLVQRQIVIKAGGWNEFLTNNQDGEFFSRVLLNSLSIRHCKKGLAYYRDINSDQKVSEINSPLKAEDAILSWKLIEESHKIRYKLDVVPYVEGKKKVLFYCIRKGGYVEVAKKYPDFFKHELKQWNFELKKKKSLKRNLRKLSNFIEVKILKR